MPLPRVGPRKDLANPHFIFILLYSFVGFDWSFNYVSRASQFTPNWIQSMIPSMPTQI